MLGHRVLGGRRRPPPPPATEARPAPLQQLKTSAQTLLTALIDKAAGVALNKVDELTDKLNEVTANGGVGLTAALAGGQAYLQGNNPLWAAAKAGFSALSAWAKAGLILALVLAAVLGLVLVAVLLLAIIVWAIIAAIRAAAR